MDKGATHILLNEMPSLNSLFSIVARGLQFEKHWNFGSAWEYLRAKENKYAKNES